jgi:copper(I)-binding protein
MVRRIEAAVLVVFALLALTSCFGDSSGPQQTVPEGGVDTSSGRVAVDDVWVNSTHKVHQGQDATVRLSLTNDGTRPDALVAASSPAAPRVTLSVHGKRVDRIGLPKGQSIDLEWRDGSGVILHDVRRPLTSGDFFDVTFQFARSPAVTVAVPVGPLGGSLSSP